MVVKAVLACSALSGPDPHISSLVVNTTDKNKKDFKLPSLKASTTKFLDLARLSCPDYLQEGLKIAVYWYVEVLEKVHVKKNSD